jgi:HTH-type transcriptional regulator / antitoxin HipB
LLTVFRKTRSAETTKVERAVQAQRPATPTTASRTTPTNARDVDMSTDHDSYEQTARRRRGSAEFREGYEQARRAFLIGQAVRERRLALGLSQTEVAARAGMTQPALSRLEAGGAVPTIPVLERIAAGLGAELIVTIAAPAA